MYDVLYEYNRACGMYTLLMYRIFVYLNYFTRVNNIFVY